MASSLTSPVRSNRQSGFTLIELLVSLTILTVILGLLSAALKTLSQNWNANATRIERLEMFSRAFDIFERDVSGMQRLVHKEKDAQQFIFSGSPERLSFVTIEPPYPTSPGPYYIQYSIERNGPEFNLIRARAPYQTKMHLFPGATPANSVELIQGRFKYKFSYALRTPKGDKWLPDWRMSDKVPDMIRLDVVDARSAAPVSPPFLAAVQTDAELGCLSESSDTCTARTNGKLVRDESQNATPEVSAR